MGKVLRPGVAATAKAAAKRHARRCRSAPAVPTGIGLRFARREMGRRERWRAVASWDPVDSDVAGRALNLEAYQVQLRATDASGEPVETTLQDEARRADGVDFTVHSGSAPANDGARELNAPTDVIKKTLTGLTTGIAVQVNFLAREATAGAEPRLKFEVWNATDGVSVAAKNETLEGIWPKLYVTRTFTPAAGKTYEGRVSFVSGTGVGLFEHMSWHDLGSVASWTQLVSADEETHTSFIDLARPRSWYYQVRVRALNRHQGQRCWSAWSEWTTPSNPVTGAEIGPPAPTGVVLRLDRVEGTKKAPWRAKVRWNEVPWWFPPDDDPVEGAAGYHVQLAISNNGGTTTANIRHKTVQSSDDDGDTVAYANFGWKIQGKRHYRGRVKAYDADGRRGAWSSWTPWASPGGAPAPPSNLTWTTPTPSVFVAKWDDPIDLTDVDRYFVQVIRAGGTVVDAGYTSGTRWRYEIPRADRGTGHKARVRSVEDPIVLDVDEDVEQGWQAADESSLVESGETPNTEQWNLDDVAVEDTLGNPMLRPTGRPRCKVRYTSGQNLANSVSSYIRWGTEDVDTDGMHPATTDNLNSSFDSQYEFTLPFEGQYIVIFTTTFGSSGVGRRQANILLNGSDRETVSQNAVDGGPTYMSGTFFIDADAGDKLTTRVFQNSGGLLALTAARLAIVFDGPGI